MKVGVVMVLTGMFLAILASEIADKELEAIHKHLHEIGCTVGAPDTCEWTDHEH